MKIFTAPYTLKGVHRLNAQAKTQERFGALLRVEWSSSVVGFADCFPWPELGDQSLDRQLKLLQENQLTPLLEQSLKFAERDAQARSQQRNLFTDLAIPPSHLLILHPAQLDKLDQYWDAGFRVLKIKVGQSLEATLDLLQKISPQWKLRLDSNLCLSADEALHWAQELKPYKQIEFWEDPTPYHAQTWVGINRLVPLAFDFGQSPREGFSVLIHKPAVQRMPQSSGAVCVTSYLDHPVGQCFAALRAGELARERDVLVCGLQSHNAYEQNEFSEEWKMVPQFTPPRGYGIGFDEQLEKLKWMSLI